MREALLEYKDIAIGYMGETVVHDVNLQIMPGEIVGVVGESGSGKSTLLRAALGVLGKEGVVERGSILSYGQNLTQMKEDEMRRIRGERIGMIFQNPGASLCPVRKIGVQFYETIREHRRLDKQRARIEILELFEKIHFRDGERILNSYPFELSGGMNQRVAIALALILHPHLILADEPTSALDVTVQAQVVKELLFIRKQYQTGILIVTHNMKLAAHMADQLVVMKDGRIVEQGKTDEVWNHPKQAYTKALIAATPYIHRG